eukprot:6517692-Lingulodinium_polyedra.AAC.1
MVAAFKHTLFNSYTYLEGLGFTSTYTWVAILAPGGVASGPVLSVVAGGGQAPRGAGPAPV